MRPKRSLWIDVSDLLDYFYLHQAPTGIQRTQYELMLHMTELARDYGFEPRLCSFRPNPFRPLELHMDMLKSFERRVAGESEDYAFFRETVGLPHDLLDKLIESGDLPPSDELRDAQLQAPLTVVPDIGVAAEAAPPSQPDPEAPSPASSLTAAEFLEDLIRAEVDRRMKTIYMRFFGDLPIEAEERAERSSRGTLKLVRAVGLTIGTRAPWLFGIRRRALLKQIEETLAHVNERAAEERSPGLRSWIWYANRQDDALVKKHLAAVTGMIAGKVDAGPDDVLINMGSSWGNPHHQLALTYFLARTHIPYVPIVYDTIPLDKLAFFPNVTREQFGHFFEFTTHAAESIVTISEFSKQRIAHHMARGECSQRPVKVIRLGDEITHHVKDRAVVGDEIQSTCQSSFILCVSTIEARKNHYGLVLAYLDLLADDPDIPDLILVGRHGWSADDVFSFLENAEWGGGKIRQFAQLNDHELALLYKHADFTVFPSNYEGWGLPVAESLGHGKTCLTSNSSSIPEVAGDLVLYFDPEDRGDLRRQLSRLVHEPTLAAELSTRAEAEYMPTAWRDTAEDVLAWVAGQAETHAESVPTKARAAALGSNARVAAR